MPHWPHEVQAIQTVPINTEHFMCPSLLSKDEQPGLMGSMSNKLLMHLHCSTPWRKMVLPAYAKRPRQSGLLSHSMPTLVIHN